MLTIAAPSPGAGTPSPSRHLFRPWGRLTAGQPGSLPADPPGKRQRCLTAHGRAEGAVFCGRQAGGLLRSGFVDLFAGDEGGKDADLAPAGQGFPVD